ncbi:hypothetical protein MN116_005048 [Schistosoma mekongi]|uniref:Histidine kinase/HSP90-like ATPase domain-containing protein n=1 Tax=Schistosoma mekongi TaxID=38744 RepID=A0AAE2D561_SCHME|nr:hypothetical protein MN116_005048 [Schistosoma mekongi]
MAMKRLRTLNLIHGLVVVTVLACVTCDQSSILSDIPLPRPNEGLSTASDTLTKEGEAISLDGLSVEQMKQAREQAEKRQFEAEVDRMMKIIVNSLYKNKEIFLRELISNASDALDKIRFLSLTNNEVLNESDDMSIRIKADKDSRTLHISDTGIGMTEAELTSNLGTIAKSGTSEFLAKMSQTNTASEKSDLIGQFGVGFYSSFLVASKVVVVSKSDKDDQHIWESNSTSFLVYKDPRGNTLKRGTEIILYLTEEAEDYLQPDTLKGVVKKYSQFISFPIYVWSSRVESQTVEPEIKDESKTTDSDSSVEEESGKKSENKTVEKVIWDWVRVNANKPIWKRKPSEVTDEEYNELFRAYSNDNDDPLAKIHFSGEGDVLFSSILYIPKHPPSNIFQMHNTHSDRIKLYVRRVYISDAAEDLLPKYLAFVFGIVDSDELPLNVSREMLQQNKLLKLIKKRLVKKVIQMISELTEPQFKDFWKEYSVNIKLGIIDDLPNRTKLSKFLRFWTSNSTENQSSLADYVSRMKKGQEEIYYLTAASLSEAKSSPFVERLIKKGYEVIYMVDPVDEYMLQSLTEYEKKRLRNVAKGTIELDKSDEAKSRKEELQKEFKPLLEWFKDNLKEYVDKTALSERLSNTPCALVANEFGWSGNMERIMTAQAYQRGEDVSSTYYSTMKKVFEINPRHPVMKKLNALIKTNKDDPTISHTANLLFDVAVLRSGFSVKNPVAFAERVESVVKKSLDIDENEVLDEELDIDGQSEKLASMDEESTLNEGSTKETLDTSQINKYSHTKYDDNQNIWKLNETETNQFSTTSPITDTFKDQINPDLLSTSTCPTCRRLLGYSSRSRSDENSEVDQSISYSQNDEDTDGNDEDDYSEAETTEFTDGGEDDDDEEEESDIKFSNYLGEKISESKIKSSFRHMRKLEESVDNNDDDNDLDDDIQYNECISICASKHGKKLDLTDSTNLEDDNADEEKDGQVKGLSVTPFTENKAINKENLPNSKNTPEIPKTKLEGDVRILIDKLQTNKEHHKENSEVQTEKATNVQNPGGLDDDEDRNDVYQDDSDDNQEDVDVEFVDGDNDDNDDDDDDHVDATRTHKPGCKKYVQNAQPSTHEDTNKEYNHVTDNDDYDHDDDDGIEDVVDDDEDDDDTNLSIQSNDVKSERKFPNTEHHVNIQKTKVEQLNDDVYDETDNNEDDFDLDRDIEEESEDDQPEDLDLEISPEEGYEDVDDPDFSDWIKADEELNPNWPGVRKLMVVKTTTTPGTPSKFKSHSHTTSGHTKNKKMPTSATTHAKVNSKTAPSKSSEIPKSKQNKDKPLLTHQHQQNQPDKSKSTASVSSQYTEDHSKKATQKSVPSQDKLKTPSATNTQSKTSANKSKPVRIIGNINDHDCDGIPDDIDEDIDNDGLLDRTQDSDWDGMLNHVDEDDDNDGIPDSEDEDANGDGIPDCRSDVSDLKLKVRYKKKMRKVDSDFDGVPDDIDGDDDDDGIPDIMEDEDKDQIPDFLGLTRADFIKGISIKELNKRMNKRGWYDHDCDGIPDNLDPDDDNDGYFDSKQDSDRDGILNEFDDDDDNDGIPDSEDPDSNGDGIPDCIVKDSDGDHIPDHIDTDDDNDGIPDLQDPDHPMFDYFRDSDKDGIPDTLDMDDDNDGIPDSIDFDSDGDGSNDLYQDIDSDGVPDSVDDDMNNDGIPDHKQDHDCDGIPDIVDPDDDNDGYFDTKQDSDNDGILNEWDDDDDNDGIPDVDDEDSNGDGIIDCQPRDSDGDGIPDHIDEDDDNDGIPDQRDPDSMSFLLYKHKRFLEAIPAHIAKHEANLLNVDLGDPNDKDCDGIPDHIDNDLDNDGKIDRTQDSDMDGILNHVDDDDDNDGIPDALDPDANGDGIPDCRRDGGLHYKLVKSPSGLIKKVLRIREPTQEEQHMAYMVNEAKRKLIRIRAKLREPVPKNTIQAIPSMDFDDMNDNPDNHKITNNANEKKMKVKSVNPKLVQSNTNMKHEHTSTTKQEIGGANLKKTSAQGLKPSSASKQQQQQLPPKHSNEHTAKSANKRQNRKLATFTPNENIDLLNSLNKDILLDAEYIDYPYDHAATAVDVVDDDIGNIVDEESVNLAEPNLKTSIFGSFLLPGAAAARSADETVASHKKEAVRMKQSETAQTKTSDKLKLKKQKQGKEKDKSTHAIRSKQYCNVDSCQKTKYHQQGKHLQKSRSITNYLQDHDSDDDDDDDINNNKDKDKPSLDSDGNGIPNDLEDEDNDGIPDYLEGEPGEDGIPDYMEDDDRDGIRNNLEDEDGDGIPEYVENCKDSKRKVTDRNHNGIPDHLEMKDSDNDGILDFYDDDDDNDGIPDDQDDDDDNDGIKDYHEDVNENQMLDILEAKDTDGDGIPDYLDDDDDGDGIPDCDDDDDDDDGILDIHEDENRNKIPDHLETEDTDKDGIIDLLDVDDDNDNIPDYLDSDSDGDGNDDIIQNRRHHEIVNSKETNMKNKEAKVASKASLSKFQPTGHSKQKSILKKATVNDDGEDGEKTVKHYSKQPLKRKDSGITSDHDESDDDDDDDGNGDMDDDETNDGKHMSKARSVVLSILKRIENIFGVEGDDDDIVEDDSAEETHDH